MRDKAQIKDKRQFYLKMFSMGSVLIMVLIVILSNVLLDKLLGKSLMFDFTKSGINSISKSTEDLLHSLPDGTNIRIIGLMDEPDPNGQSDMSILLNQFFAPVLDKYVEESDGKVTVEYINPAVDPNIVWELDPNNANNIASGNCFVVEYNKKLSVIQPLDCLEEVNGTLASSRVEYCFTNAIINLTQGYFGKAYFITGLGEEGNECIKTVLEGINIQTEDLLESTDLSIPEDCTLLVLNGPNSDISEHTCYAIQDYIKSGGNVFVAVNFKPDNISVDYKNLNKALNTVGIEIENSQVIDFTAAYNLRKDDGTAFLLDVDPEYNSFKRNEFFRAGDVRPLKISDGADQNARAEAVFYTSEGAYKAGAKSNQERLNVVMHGGYEGTEANVYVCGTTFFSSDSYINGYGYGDSNVEFLKACLKALTNSGASTEIPIKSVNTYRINTSMITTTSISIMTVCFMMIIPIALVIVAVAVYTRRKNM